MKTCVVLLSAISGIWLNISLSVAALAWSFMNVLMLGAKSSILALGKLTNSSFSRYLC